MHHLQGKQLCGEDESGVSMCSEVHRDHVRFEKLNAGCSAVLWPEHGSTG